MQLGRGNRVYKHIGMKDKHAQLEGTQKSTNK